MSEAASPSRTLEQLRQRAQWYREFAAVCGGDNGWCLSLAAHYSRLADELERRLSADPASSAGMREAPRQQPK